MKSLVTAGTAPDFNMTGMSRILSKTELAAQLGDFSVLLANIATTSSSASIPVSLRLFDPTQIGATGFESKD